MNQKIAEYSDEKGKTLKDKIRNKKDKENLEIAQFFLKSHIITREGLKKIGVIRTNKLAHAEYAEWLVAKLFNAKVADNNVQEGYDVIYEKNNTTIKYEVKSRLVDSCDSYTAFHVKLGNEKFDHLACVFLTTTFDVLGVFTMTYEALQQVGTPDPPKTRISLIWKKQNLKKYEPHIKWVWKVDDFS